MRQISFDDSDLMYIIAVQTLAKRFAHDATGVQSAAFVALYLGVYWSWCGEVMYLDRFETNGTVSVTLFFFRCTPVQCD